MFYIFIWFLYDFYVVAYIYIIIWEPKASAPGKFIDLKQSFMPLNNETVITLNRSWNDPQDPVGLTWLEEHDGLEAGELCGIDGEGLEAAEDLLQEAQVQAGVAGFSLHAGAEVRQGEQRAAVQRQRPLDGTQQEELAPRLLQQDHLVGHEQQR